MRPFRVGVRRLSSGACAKQLALNQLHKEILRLETCKKCFRAFHGRLSDNKRTTKFTAGFPRPPWPAMTAKSIGHRPSHLIERASPRAWSIMIVVLL